MTNSKSIEKSNKGTRNGFLDIVKIVATILIVFHHFQQSFDVKFSFLNFFDDTFYFGRLVELFFMISGFLIVSYIPKIKNGVSIKQFFVKRYLRLIPVVAISTVIDLFVKLIPYSYTLDKRYSGVLLETFSVAFGFHGLISSKVTSANNPMWYVSILILCYFVFYVLVIVSKKTYDSVFQEFILNLLFVLIGIIILVAKCDYPFANIYIGRGFASFFGGVVLGVVLPQFSLSKKWVLPLMMFVFVISIVPAFIFQGLSNREENVLYMICFCYSPLIVISQLKPIIYLSDNKFLCTLANVSFHVYCFHTPINNLLSDFTIFKDCILRNGFVCMILVTIIAYVVGYCSYCFIEKPLARIFKKNDYNSI